MASQRLFILNATIINEGNTFVGDLLIEGGVIQHLSSKECGGLSCLINQNDNTLNAEGKYLIPGVIDDHVHFREPGLTDKADIKTESRAAVAGGVTSFMEMPNTIPKALTHEILEEKYRIASEKSIANYSFYIGASNDNIDEILKSDPEMICGVKLFLGASTGNMLVDDTKSLNKLFSESPLIIAVHSEDEEIIQNNLKEARGKYGEDIPVTMHPLIRSAEACYKSTALAVDLATKHNARIHITHLSTARELKLLSNHKPLKDKRITAEACIHHLVFNDSDYEKLGFLVKWNPAVKTAEDQKELLKGLLNDKIDLIATDHAPHQLKEKMNPYLTSPSGGPMIQHGLAVMLEFYHDGKISLENIVRKMCHAPAECFKIDRRGFLREGYWADMVLLDLDSPWEINKRNILYKCKWSPLEGRTLRSKVTHTFVNGKLVYHDGKFDEKNKGMRLKFNIKD